MAIDIYDTRAMLAAMQQEAPTNQFIIDTLFTRVETFDTEYVDIDIVKGDEKLAPFVAPIVEGRVVKESGFKTNTYKPAYVKPKYITNAADIIRDRLAGESAYATSSASNRAAVRLAKQLKEGTNKITRREEWMAAQAITEGTVTVQGDGIDMVIDFGLSASHKITLSGADLWSDATNSNPIMDISGYKANISELIHAVP